MPTAVSGRIVISCIATIGLVLTFFAAYMMYLSYTAPVIQEGYIKVNSDHLKRYRVKPGEGEFALWANDGYYSMEDIPTNVDIRQGFIEIVNFERAEETMCARIRDDFFANKEIEKTPWDNWRQLCFDQHP